MRDAISYKRAMDLHPAIREEVVNIITELEMTKLPANISVRIIQGLRTFPDQQALYDQGRTKPGNRVTNSKAGQSYHNYGLAIDFFLVVDGKGSWDTTADRDKDGESDWMEVVDSFETKGYTWGGRFTSIKDAPHFEKNFGINWRELLRRHEAKEFIPGTEYVKL